MSRFVILAAMFFSTHTAFAQPRNCTAELKSVNQKSCDEASRLAGQKCSEAAVQMGGDAASATGMHDLHGVQVTELKSRWQNLAKAKSACDQEWIECRAVCMKVMQCLGGQVKRDPANAAQYKAEDDRITPIYNDCNGKYQDFARNLNRQMYAIQEAIRTTEANARAASASGK